MILAVIICVLIAYFVKSIISDFTNNPLRNAQAQEPPVKQKYVPATLQKYNGTNGEKVYIAVKGTVYDVSNGKSFYGPGGPYENFAGRDASRGLALNSFDAEVLTPVDQPLDTLENLSPEEKESLDNWLKHFENKYTVVGTLHNPGEI